MGAYKEYPPTLAGTTPPFFATGSGTYNLRVPFTMNKMVNISSVGGIKLRIRAADTDLEIGRLNNYNMALSSEETSYADFNLTPIAASIHVGKFYKIQIAYIDKYDSSAIGYYSQISITKCTSQPVVGIAGLDRYSSNVDITSYTGLYSNINDPTEKCYQYKFTLYDKNDNVVDTSDWCLHNANTDDSSTESNDYYMLNYTCESSEKYRLQYSVITNNNLQVDSPMYMLVGSTSVAPELKADLIAEIDYDNGCVNLSLEPWLQNKQDQALTTYTGQFVVTRSSSKENFKTWTKIVTFQLSGTIPKGIVFTDFTIEHGQTYRYALQQFNDNQIYSSRVYTADVIAAFEDAYLFDGEKQLRIRFNPKVSSFKTVIQDSKKNTLGSKFPFFFRNGNISYKEFPISGLISYMIDENEYFITRAELGMDVDWQDTTDIIDENIAFERKFKLAVMDWLNDGKPKLFRSPGEGNYIVRLTNVSLTPNDSLSRMIHTFQCTADEIDLFNPRKLIEHGFLKIAEYAPLELRFGTINFDEMIETIIGSIIGTTNPRELEIVDQETVDRALELFEQTDLLNGRECQYLKFEECRGGSTWFSLGGDTQYVIGSTGQYENTFTTPVMNLNILKPWRHMPGSVTYGIWTTQTSHFDTVASITQRDVIENPAYTRENYIEQITNTKDKIQRIYGMYFKLNDLAYEIGSLEEFCEAYNLYLITGAPDAYDVIFGLSEAEYRDALRRLSLDTTLTQDEQVEMATEIHDLYLQTQEWASDVSRLRANAAGNIKASARERFNEGRTYSDLFVDGALFIDLTEGATYQFDYEQGQLVKWEDAPTVTIETYDTTTRSFVTDRVHLTPTQICIDNDIIDIAETGYLDVPSTDTVPKQLYWGSKVVCTLVYQLLTIGYGVESQVNNGINQSESLANAYKRYSNAAKYRDANRLEFIRISKNAASFVTAIPDGDFEECSYFTWNEQTLHFDRIPREKRSFFKNTEMNEVWIPRPYAGPERPDGAWIPEGDVFDNLVCIPYQPTRMMWISYGNGNAEEEYIKAKDDYFKLLDAELAVQEKKLVLNNGED